MLNDHGLSKQLSGKSPDQLEDAELFSSSKYLSLPQGAYITVSLSILSNIPLEISDHCLANPACQPRTLIDPSPYSRVVGRCGVVKNGSSKIETVHATAPSFF